MGEKLSMYKTCEASNILPFNQTALYLCGIDAHMGIKSGAVPHYKQNHDTQARKLLVYVEYGGTDHNT